MSRTPFGCDRRLVAVVLIVLVGSGLAYALDRSKLPIGADHQAAQNGVAGLYTGRTGAGTNIGIIEALGSGNPAGMNHGIDGPRFHCGARLKLDGDFQGQAPGMGPNLGPFPGFSDHGTLVTDVAASDDPFATGHLGVARAADVYVGWTNTFTDILAAFRHLEAAPRNIRLYNNSYGFGATFMGVPNDASNLPARFFDWYSSQRDALLVKSAGNRGPPPPPAPDWQITIPGDAHNCITVGAVDETFRRRANYSSYRLDGEAPGGLDIRGKPDIVAPGGSLAPGDAIDNDSAAARRISQAGTSFAAPHVTGASAMLIEAGLGLPGPAMRNRLAHKAIILNAARKRFISPPKNDNGIARDGFDVCIAGANGGNPCTVDSECPGSTCAIQMDASDYDYLTPAGDLRVGATGAGGTPKTRDWTPTNWTYNGTTFSTTRPLDDELGTGVLDVERVLIQHAGGEQVPGPITPIGWNRDALSPALSDDVYTFSSPIRRGRFITATLTWDRAVIEVNHCQGGANVNAVCTTDSECPGSTCGVAGVIDANDTYVDAPDALPDFDLKIYRLPGPVLVAESIGVGGAGIGENVEHLHIPVPETGTYEIHVKNNGPGGLVNYGLAWWTTTLPLNHYQCYEVDRATFSVGGVSVVDVFGPSTVTLVKPKRLCNPANKNGEDPAALTDEDHLTGYIMKQTSPPFVKVTNQTVANQFGTVVVDVVKPNLFLMPTAKSLFGPPSPISSPAVDHFKCYKIRHATTPGVPPVTINDQFGTFLFDVKKPLRFCAAANKNNEGVLDPTAALMCYKVKHHTPPVFRGPGTPAYVLDQFHADAYDVNHARELCVPSTLISP